MLTSSAPFGDNYSSRLYHDKGRNDDFSCDHKAVRVTEKRREKRERDEKRGKEKKRVEKIAAERMEDREETGRNRETH
jgi:hypothetical protein